MLGVSLLFSGSIDVKNINHLVAYTTVVALYYFFVKFLFAAAGTWAHYESRVRTVLVCSVLLVSVYTMLEFIDTKDRKSTRLNSSHSQISYAVFCLKKKNNELSSPSNPRNSLLITTAEYQ